MHESNEIITFMIPLATIRIKATSRSRLDTGPIAANIGPVSRHLLIPDGGTLLVYPCTGANFISIPSCSTARHHDDRTGGDGWGPDVNIPSFPVAMRKTVAALPECYVEVAKNTQPCQVMGH